MSLTLYGHSVAAYTWKVLIALYENATPFRFRVIEDAAVWPSSNPSAAQEISRPP